MTITRDTALSDAWRFVLETNRRRMANAEALACDVYAAERAAGKSDAAAAAAADAMIRVAAAENRRDREQLG